jgi:steroid delta-isomerase-like uncharacterized protein
MTDAAATVQEWVAAIEALDLEKTLFCFADDIISEDPAYGYRFAGLSDVRRMYIDVYSLPDLKFDVMSSFVSGDGMWAAVEWTWSGTKSDQRYSIPGVSIIELRSGKIVRETIYYDKTSSPY